MSEARARREPRLLGVTVAHWDEVEFHHRGQGRDGRRVAAARRRGRHTRRRRQPGPRRAGQAADASPLAQRLGGALLRALGIGPRVAGRRGARGAAARLRHPPPRRAGAHVRRRAGRARVPRLRHAPSDGDTAGYRAPARSGSAGPGSRGATTARGTSRRPSGRSSTASRRRGRRTSSTSTRSSTRSTRAACTTAPLATHERSTLAGLHWEKLAAGRRGCVPHCHSAEEEVFVILEGTATLELWPSPRSESDAKEEMPLRAGHRRAPVPRERVSRTRSAPAPRA